MASKHADLSPVRSHGVAARTPAAKSGGGTAGTQKPGNTELLQILEAMDAEVGPPKQQDKVWARRVLTKSVLAKPLDWR